MTNRSEVPVVARADHLDAETIAELRRLLEAERAALLERTLDDSADELLESTATRGQGETEHTVNEIERGVHALLDASARESLADIEHALARIEEGSYGICEACGGPIPAERLLAVPAARLCVRCQGQRGRRR
jgi:RNA polymerase-binding protein DksA